YGRELLHIEQRRRSSSVDSFVVAGESGAGDHSEPAALRPVTDFFAGNRPAGPSLAARWSFEPALRTAQSAATAGTARKRVFAAGLESGSFSAFLQPALRPGAVIEIQETPTGRPDGPVWIEGVRHKIDARGAR